MPRHSKLSLIAIALVIAGPIAHAAPASQNDAFAVTKAKISLTEAIAVAEQHVHGKAGKAEFEPSKQHGWVYDIEVVNGAKVLDVKVDADRGTIISSNEDKADRDDDQDETD